MKNVVIIYHYVDFDGMCSAKIVETKYKDSSIILIKYNYGEDIPFDKVEPYINDEESLIVMVDVSWPVEMMEKLNKGRFIWIDHHKTAIQKVQEANLKIEGIQKEGEAACVLTYKYFFNTKYIPAGINLLGLHDVWSQNDKIHSWENRILPFQYGLKAKVSSFETFPEIAELMSTEYLRKVIAEGKVVLSYLENDYPNHNKKAFEVILEGKKLLALNTTLSGSAPLIPLFNPKKHDGMLLFRYCGDIQQWTYGLYSERKDVDLSTIALKHGGGGHPQACGFETEKLIDELKNILWENAGC